MANSVNPDQSVLGPATLFVASILNSSVMLGNYLQQTTSADDIFRCIFLDALRVNVHVELYCEASVLVLVPGKHIYQENECPESLI